MQWQYNNTMTRQRFVAIQRHKSFGFGLLEIMLTLVIIMILMVTSMLYWQSAQRAALVEQGYELIQDIVEMAQGWQPTHLNKGKYSGVSANALLQEGGIPKQYITNFDGRRGFHHGPIDISAKTGLITPWLGDSQVNVAQAENGVLNITFSLIPNYACMNLANRINGESALEYANSSSLIENTDRAHCELKNDDSGASMSTLNVWYYPDV